MAGMPSPGHPHIRCRCGDIDERHVQRPARGPSSGYRTRALHRRLEPAGRAAWLVPALRSRPCRNHRARYRPGLVEPGRARRAHRRRPGARRHQDPPSAGAFQGQGRDDAQGAASPRARAWAGAVRRRAGGARRRRQRDRGAGCRRADRGELSRPAGGDRRRRRAGGGGAAAPCRRAREPGGGLRVRQPRRHRGGLRLRASRRARDGRGAAHRRQPDGAEVVPRRLRSGDRHLRPLPADPGRRRRAQGVRLYHRR